MGRRRGLLWRGIAPLLVDSGKLPTEAPFDAEISQRDGVVEGRAYFHDLAFLRVNCQFAAHSAIRTDGIGVCLLSFIPRRRGSHIVLGLEHQRARGADANA